MRSLALLSSGAGCGGQAANLAVPVDLRVGRSHDTGCPCRGRASCPPFAGGPARGRSLPRARRPRLRRAGRQLRPAPEWAEGSTVWPVRTQATSTCVLPGVGTKSEAPRVSAGAYVAHDPARQPGLAIVRQQAPRAAGAAPRAVHQVALHCGYRRPDSRRPWLSSCPILPRTAPHRDTIGSVPGPLQAAGPPRVSTGGTRAAGLDSGRWTP